MLGQITYMKILNCQFYIILQVFRFSDSSEEFCLPGYNAM
jgi:hypothetical protein